jgi:mannose-6-phosphate isomerase
MDPLECTVQNYAWGKPGLSSIIAQLLKSSSSDFTVDDRTPYAELWMGTHPSGHSKVITKDGTKVELRDYLGHNLPFLFKVLSVNQALSIQAHPNNELAKELHKSDPKNYKDENHKPELCCALTDFEVMCAFRPLKQIANFIRTVPELRELFSKETIEEFERHVDDKYFEQVDEQSKKKRLKALFTAFMNANETVVKKQLNTIVERLRKIESNQLSREESVLLRLYGDYAGDVGCFAVFFLNLVTLQPGEALFLAPNEPHSYLYGDCVEVMPCSDNVVRAGLTSKFRDVRTLCDMLTYNDNSLEVYMNFGKGKSINPAISVYKPPVPEFQLFRIQLEKSQGITSTKFTAPTVSILIAINGHTSISVKHNNESFKVDAKPGSIYLIQEKAELALLNDSDEESLLFIASSNPDFDQKVNH